MQNVEMKVSDGRLHIVVELERARPTASRTGKTLVIASTHGNKRTDSPIGPVFVGINVYAYPEDYGMAKKARDARE